MPKIPAIPRLTPADNKNILAVAARFSTVAIAIFALYSQDLTMVFNDALHSEASFHILAVPFIFAYLLYRKRKMVSASIPLSSTEKKFFQKNFATIAGIILCATAFLAYWFGSYTFTPLEYHMITLPIFTAGLILILFNPQTLRQLFFPIAFLIFLTPPPVEILYTVGSALSDLSAVASNGLASILGLHSTLASNYGSPIITLIRPDQTVMNFSIDVACSGIYSLIGFVIFAVFIAYITRGKKRNKFAILLMGIPLIIALNIIRITTILVIGYYYGDEIALQIFHTVGATVLMFIGT
ncbi:MAG: exosortase/archaeosortase family protein, partial [Candidatus Bathyarchaeia archaeon]